MTVSSIYGPVFDADRICRAAKETLDDWLVPWLAEVERQNDLEVRKLPQPKSIRTGVVLDDWPEDKLPTVIVYSPGLAGNPRKRGDGMYEVDFALAAGVILPGSSRADTRARLTQYVAAIRSCLLSKGLKGIDAWFDWTDETYGEGRIEQSRTIAAGEAGFVVTVEMAAYDRGGPATPPDDPYVPPNEPGVVETTHIEIEKDN